MAYTGNGIAGMLDTVDKTAGVYAGNPGKLKQAMDKQPSMGNIPSDLIDALALQKITSEKEAAKNQMMLAQQQNPKTIVDQLEEKATALTKNEVTGQVGDVLQQKQQKQQKAQQKMLAQATKPQGAGIGNLLGGAPQGGAPQGGAPQGRPMPQGNPMQGGVAAAAGGLMRAQFKKGGDVDARKFSVEGNIAQIEKYAESQGGKLSQQVMQSMAAASKNNRAIVDFLKTKYGFDGFAAGAEDLYGRTRMPSADNAAINERLRAENVDPNARTASTAVDAFMNYGSGPLVDKEGGGKRYMTQEERVAKQENEAGLKKAMADEDAQFGLEDDLERLMADEDAQFAADDTAGIDAQVQGVIEGGADPYAKVDAALAAAKGNAGESAGGLEIGSAAQDLTKENLKGLGALKEDGKVNPQPFKAEQEAARADSDKYYKRQANEDAYKKDMETRKKFYGEYDPEADKERQSEAFAAYVGRGKGGAAQGLQAQMQVRNAQSKAREGQMLGLEALGQKGREQDRLIADKGTSRYDSIGSNGTSILNAAVQGFSVASQQDMIKAREDLDRKDKTIARKMEANLAEAELEMKKITAAGEASATQRKDVLSLIVTAEDNILKAKQDIFAVYEPQISMAQQQGKDTAALIDVRDKAVDGVIAGYSGVLTKLNEMAGVNKPNLSGSPYSDSPDVNSIVGEKLKTKQ
jgi:hypothetical protein